jgi:hypothetical protein
VAPDGLSAATSNASGNFTIDARTAGRYRSTVSGAGVYDRQTTLAVPGSNVQVSLIPTSFDITSFDQMFRTSESHLQRWMQAPALIVEAADLVFSSVTDVTYVATSRTLSDADVNSIVSDLTWGLPQMTGGAFSAFASVTIDHPAAGASVSVQRGGAIVAGRYEGLTAATGYAGYGRWAALSDGTVTAGIALYDADIDRAGHSSPPVLRVHEMGHALGYSHVLSRSSLMNASPSLGPNDFDVQAARIAFQRAPGSRSPDVDPDSGLTNAMRAVAAARWGPPIP